MLMAFGLGLIPYSVQYVVLRAFYAYEDTRTPFYNTVIVAAVNAVASAACYFVLPARWAVVGMAASYGVAYAIGVGEKTLFLHLPIGFETTTQLNGVETKLRAESNYPWSGKFTLHVDPAKPVDAEVRFRIPEWAEDVETEVPGLEEPAEYENGYIVIRKQWKPGDVATFNIELKPKWIAADPRVKDNLGRLALSYGPLIYAAEEHDNGFAPQLLSIDAAADVITARRNCSAESRP